MVKRPTQRIIFVEKLGTGLTLRLRWYAGPTVIVHAVEVSTGARRMTEWMTWTGMGSLDIKAWDWRFNHVASAYGYLALQRDTVALAHSIVDSEVASTAVMTGLAEEFDQLKVLLYFRKALAHQLEKTVALIHAARLHADAQCVKPDGAVTIYLRSGPGQAAISEYARTHGVSVQFYGGKEFSRYLSRFVQTKTASVLSVSGKPMKSGKMARQAQSDNREIAQSRDHRIGGLAANYTGKIMTLDCEKRSDWFWLAESPNLRSRSTIYFQRTDLPIDQETSGLLESHGIRVVALNEKARKSHAVSLWRSGGYTRAIRRRLFRKLGMAWLTGLIRWQRISSFYLMHTVRFISTYAYWLEFFRAHAIKVNVNNWDFAYATVPMHQAIEHAGGISVSYQWSNIEFPSVINSSGADVLLSFGPVYQSVWANNGSCIDSLVFSGYITDHAFDRVRGKSLALRRQLQARGAEFILCFFDENSSDDRYSIIPNSVTARAYQWCLSKLLQDETFGLILKPGYPLTLKMRIGPLDGLWERAMSTGRCVMLERGSHVTEQYPAEAAQAADLCVGLLISGTAALEAYLSGTPTVFLDLERCYWNPVYNGGHRTLVFDDLDDLDKAITEFRINPSSHERIGNLARWAERRDPFHDGRAAARIAQYVTWLLECLDQGGTREDALAYAYRRHVAQWGAKAAMRYPDRGLSGRLNETAYLSERFDRDAVASV